MSFDKHAWGADSMCVGRTKGAALRGFFCALSVVALATGLALFAPAGAALAATKDAATPPVILVGTFADKLGSVLHDNIGVGMGMQVSNALLHAGGAKIIAEDERRIALAQLRYNDAGSVDSLDAAETAKQAGATYFVYGTYARSGDELTATANIVDAESGKVKGTAAAKGTAAKAGDLCVALAENVISTLGKAIGKGKGKPKLTFDSDAARQECVYITIDVLAIEGELEEILYTNGIMRLEVPTPELDLAAQLCRQALAADPGNATMHRHLGDILAGVGDFDGAIAEYGAALKIDPKSKETHNNFGRALYYHGDTTAAMAEYTAALGIDPDFASPHCNIGLILFDKGDTDGAISEYRKAIELNPNFALAHYNLAVVYAVLDRDGDALGELKLAIAIDPSYKIQAKRDPCFNSLGRLSEFKALIES